MSTLPQAVARDQLRSALRSLEIGHSPVLSADGAGLAYTPDSSLINPCVFIVPKSPVVIRGRSTQGRPLVEPLGRIYVCPPSPWAGITYKGKAALTKDPCYLNSALRLIPLTGLRRSY